MTPVEFRGDLWRQKTRVPGLSCGVVCVILRFAVLVEHRLVTDTDTDRQTDGHRPMASTADAQHRAVKIGCFDKETRRTFIFFWGGVHNDIRMMLTTA